MQGRFHSYEGYSTALCTMPMKVFKLMGIESVVLTCAAGGLNRSLEAGDIMVIKDHLSPLLWTLQNPLVGVNDERFGPRFPATNKIYSKQFRDTLHKVSNELDITIKEGVLITVGGPNYETVADARALMSLGADAVSASTTHEALVAFYCGLNVLALVLVTNRVVIDYDSEEVANHEEVLETANRRAKDVEDLIIRFVSSIN